MPHYYVTHGLDGYIAGHGLNATLHPILSAENPALNVNSVKIKCVDSRQLGISRYNIPC